LENRFKKNIVADMHTHSENSHDSVCKIRDMYNAELLAGTELMAVTDHCDIAFSKKTDIISPIIKSRESINVINKENGSKNILFGVEISEGFWDPESYNKVMKSFEFDVIIGSVHIVDDPVLNMPYSAIDFSLLDTETIFNYLDRYFDDMIRMIDFADFDILAHLTCPLRYINGKYKLGVSLAPYERKIENILQKIIARKISLEVNTSSLDILSDYMPTRDILKKYACLGGKMVTLGSDAHVAEKASVSFKSALEDLLDLGFDRLYYYIERKPYFTEIEV